MPPQITNLFSVPFVFNQFPQPERLNAALKRCIFAQEMTGQAAANPNPLTQRNSAVFESHFNLFRMTDPAVQELKGFCWTHLLALVAHMNGYDQKTVSRLLIYNDSWFHVTRRGGFFGLHNHPNASWSGVYCVDPGRSDPDKPDSGAVNFFNPMIQSGMFMDAGNAQMKLPYSNQLARLSLTAGQLVLFPSWLLHDVKPFEGEGERVTIAFNCWFTLPD